MLTFARRSVSRERRRWRSLFDELRIPADLRYDERYLARERLDRYVRARLGATTLTCYTIGAIPVLAVVATPGRWEVPGMAAAWALVAVLLWKIGVPRLRHHPTFLGLLVCAIGTAFTLSFEPVEPDLHNLAIGCMTVLPLASTILFFWRPATHLLMLEAFYAITIAYAELISPATEPSERSALIVVTGVSCLLSAFGNVEGTLRRNGRAREARQLRLQRAELRQIARERAQEARTDVLTGLRSRRAMNEDLESLQARLAASGTGAAVALLDLDRFKLYNDRYGHAAGDRLLSEVGRVLRDCLRLGDVAYRYGGEEFLLVLEDATAPQAETVVERVREIVRSEGIEHPDNAPWGVVTFSAGVAEVDPARGAPIETALRRAAKGRGRNRTVVEQAGSRSRDRRRRDASGAAAG